MGKSMNSTITLNQTSKRLLTLTVGTGLLVACSGAQNTKNCAKVYSYLIEEGSVTASIARETQYQNPGSLFNLPAPLAALIPQSLQVPWGPNAGGFLDIGIREKPMDPQSSTGQRCTFYLDSDAVGASDKWFLWTADHCLQDHLMKDIQLSIYNAKSGSYFKTFVQWNPLDQIAQVRSAWPDMPVEVSSKLFDSFQRSQTGRRDKALAACANNFNAIGKQGASQVVCGSNLDIARMEVSFKSTISPELQTHLNEVRANQKGPLARMREVLAQGAPLLKDKNQGDLLMAFSKLELGEIQGAFSDLTKRRGLLGVVKLTQALKSCPQSAHPLCAHKDKILALPIFKDHLNTEVSAFEANLQLLEGKVNIYTQKLLTIKNSSVPFLHYVSNQSFGSEAGAVDSKATSGTLVPSAYVGIPAHSMLDQNLLADPIKAAKFIVSLVDDTYIVTFPIKTGPGGTYLQPGDSGSMVAFMGLVPFGMVVSVDGNPTSGGVVLRPLPPEEEEPQSRKDSDATTAGEKKPSSTKSVTRCK